MYKNFNLTEEERKQILEQHSTYGYRNPLREYDDDEEYFARHGDKDEQPSSTCKRNVRQIQP